MTSRIDSAPVGASLGDRSRGRIRRPGHAVLEGEEEIFVQFLCFLARLFEQALPLHERIVQLGVTGRDFLAVDVSSKTSTSESSSRFCFASGPIPLGNG